MAISRLNLDALPVELLYEIQFYALSEDLPHTNRRIYSVFKSAPPTVQAEYIVRQHLLAPPFAKPVCIVTRALRFPICNSAVLDAVLRRGDVPKSNAAPELPRRLFRPLTDRAPGGGSWKDRHEPLPFLQHLYSHPQMQPPDADSHNGYALARAVFAGFRPLVHFLLEHGASPKRKNGLAVLLAIKRGDLGMVKLLIEPAPGAPAGRAKKRRVADRMQVDAEMLKTAVRCNAMDIAEYLMAKGCVPDIKTLGLLMKHNVAA
ncbi:hypothetical protein BV25DRAFT_1092371 [Artomyces pyxidatus]|uniref:Uncharacterized protein n=1 Tax=Artomyces pyxidatus TaxID=48021 RepID=A0ACB8TFY9_9AGAM|nr:hypothetical protein BV25DRAFT_1092371 [Artomyces pyxidatus]